MKSIPRIEVVLPIFNEEQNIPILLRELDVVTEKLSGRAKLQYLFINDASTDGSTRLLRQVHARRNDVRVVELLRNFGHGGAVHCGIEHFDGDIAVFMDADLQDSPGIIVDMFEAWEKGEHTVVADRVARKERIRVFIKVFYFLLNRIAKLPNRINFGTFCLLDRSVVERMRQLKERNPYFPGLVILSSARLFPISTSRNARIHGNSRMGLRRQIRLALIALVSYSSTPVHIVSGIGMLSSLGAMAAGVVIICEKLFTDKAIPGWASILTAVFFASGVQLMCLGIIGEYIARVYDEVKGRPMYFIGQIFERKKSFTGETTFRKAVA
jgi:dolichol-phosphate mannosyltransferase